MRKKYVALLLALLLVLLCGCGSKAAKDVDALILAIGEVDEFSGPVVAYVREQYELLTEDDKESLKKYDVLLSAEAAYVDAVIESIGEVTADSANVIATAEAAYASLVREARELVTGISVLQDAGMECEKKVLIRSLSGVWVNEVLGDRSTQIGRGLIHSYGLDETNCHPEKTEECRFELQEDGMLQLGESRIGFWELSADERTVIMTANGETSELKLVDEGGYQKLVGSLFENEAFGYVREADYLPAFHEKYEVVELNRDNIHSYFSDPVVIGKVETLKGKAHSVYWYDSKAFDDGLVYFGSSCVIPVKYDHGGKGYNLWLEFPMLSTTGLKIKNIFINTETRISGEVFYVKDSYVSGNYINADGYRVLELTNGISMVFDGYDEMMNTFWNRCDAEYQDYMY